jgi:hypothetical protein
VRQFRNLAQRSARGGLAKGNVVKLQIAFEEQLRGVWKSLRLSLG